MTCKKQHNKPQNRLLLSPLILLIHAISLLNKAIRLNTFHLREKVDISKLEQACEVSLVISSGSLILAAMLEDIGLMDERFFIDYADTE